MTSQYDLDEKHRQAYRGIEINMKKSYWNLQLKEISESDKHYHQQKTHNFNRIHANAIHKADQYLDPAAHEYPDNKRHIAYLINHGYDTGDPILNAKRGIIKAAFDPINPRLSYSNESQNLRGWGKEDGDCFWSTLVNNHFDNLLELKRLIVQETYQWSQVPHEIQDQALKELSNPAIQDASSAIMKAICNPGKIAWETPTTLEQERSDGYPRLRSFLKQDLLHESSQIHESDQKLGDWKKLTEAVKTEKKLEIDQQTIISALKSFHFEARTIVTNSTRTAERRQINGLTLLRNVRKVVDDEFRLYSDHDINRRSKYKSNLVPLTKPKDTPMEAFHEAIELATTQFSTTSVANVAIKLKGLISNLPD